MKSLLRELRQVLGRRYVMEWTEELLVYEYDGSVERAAPQLDALPANVEQVSGVVGIARRPACLWSHGALAAASAAGTRAGPTGLAYGVTTNHVLGMEVVLADGSMVWSGGRRHESTGYDLRGVLIGSEGTLAVTTKVAMRLQPVPEAVTTMLAIFPEEAAERVERVLTRNGCEVGFPLTRGAAAR